MNLARRFLMLLLWMLCGAWCAANASAQVLQLDHGREPLAGHVSVLIDPGKRLSFREVADPGNRSHFRPLAGELNAGLLDAVVWMRFELQRAPGRAMQWWLEVQPNTIEHATLYIPEFDGSYSARDSGSTVPFSQRDLRYRNPVFKLHVWGSRPQVFYLKIDTRGTVAPRLTVWRPTSFLEAVGREHATFGLCLGIYAMLVLASFCFELALRDGVYRSFGLCVFSCMLLMIGDSGMLFQYVFPEHPSWAGSAFGLIIAMSLYACIDFLFRFLAMPQRHPRFTRACLTTVGVFALLTAAGVMLAGYAETIRVLSVLLTFFVAPLIFVILIRPAWESTSEIRYAFLVTGALMFLSLMVQFLLRLGYLERNWFTEYAAVIASLVFFLLIHYAISRRYLAMRAAKEAAQKELLELHHKAGLQLERQVNARTRDLQRAMATVEHALAQNRAAYEEQRQFIVTVSHELRTPLAVIDATAQNLMRNIGQHADKTMVKLRKIYQASGRLSSLLDTYLNNNRLDVISHGATPVEVELLPLLQDALSAACPLADRHRLVLEKDALPERIRTDPDFLRLVLRILTDNAVKYTPPGTTVTLRAKDLQGGWSIEIADDGQGIADDEQELIFTRHYRGRSSAGTAGSGLGLALARHLMEMLGGTLTLAHSQQGATFCIWLPAPDDPQPASAG